MRSVSRQPPFAKKSLGQNFLVDANYINKIIDALSPSSSDTIVEIGPGRGALTDRLVQSGAKVIAVELDRELAAILTERFRGTSRFQLIEGNVLEIDLRIVATSSDDSAAKLVANLPYYISTAILQRLADQREVFSGLVLMFQKEVAERVTAPPGDSERGYLTVIVEEAFKVEKLFDVPPEAFRPRPKVWSSVLTLLPKERSVENRQVFHSIVSLGFRQKRKTLLNNLKTEVAEAVRVLERSGIEPTRRAETVTLEEWLSLTNYVATESRVD